MSLSQAVKCDGCGQTVEAIRLKPGDKHLIPIGWVRMPVWKRHDGTSRVGEVEICRPECATFALSKFFVSDPVDLRSPPSADPGSDTSLSVEGTP